MPIGNDKGITAANSLYETVRQIMEQVLLEVHTAMPGRVVSFDDETQTATVQPCLKTKFVDADDASDRPPITGVPVQFPQYGKARIRGPVAKDDEGLIVWSMRSIDQWLEKGGLVDPIENRAFDYSDAVFIPGVTSKPAVLPRAGAPENLEIVHDETIIELAPDGKVSIRNGTDDLMTLIHAAFQQLSLEPFITGKSVFALLKTKMEGLKL